MPPILLIACSKTKATEGYPLPAQEVYKGAVFRLALEYGKRMGYTVLILSAKYGFITTDFLITENYNTKLAKPFAGEYPPGEGYYFGGLNYFRYAPPRYKRLCPNPLPVPWKMGHQLSYIRNLLQDLQ